MLLSDDGEEPYEEDSSWSIGLLIWFLHWWVIRGGDDGSSKFNMEFRLSLARRIKDLTNGICRTCWTK